MLSGAALILSLLGISLLHIELLSPRVLCTWGSATIFLLATPWLLGDVIKIRRLEVSERAQVSMPLVIFFDSLALVMMVLQLVNWLFLKEQWPFYLALVLIIAGAFQQFILLVQTGIRED
jgi:FtsH-binding integral membrane protein